MASPFLASLFEWLKPFECLRCLNGCAVSMATPFGSLSLRRKILRLYNSG